MQFQETKSRELQLLEEDRQKKLQAENVFKQSKWGKVLSVVKSNLSESIRRRSDHHVHHHHHFHHYYHHEHVVQTPRETSADVTHCNPTFVVSHHSSVSHSPPMIHDPSCVINTTRNPTVLVSRQGSLSQSPHVSSTLIDKPNDAVLSLEMTSNCKISHNFLSPYTARLSSTWSAESVSSEQVCFSPDAVSLCSNEDLGKASDVPSVGTKCQLKTLR